MKKQLTALLLLLAIMPVLMLAACGGDPGSTPNADSDVTESAGETTVAESTRQPLNLPQADYNGYEFRVLEYELCNHIQYYDFDWSRDMGGELINDAVMKRNLIVEERYNCIITAKNDANVLTLARNSITAGSDDYDIMEPYINNAMSMSMDGLFLNFYDIPLIDMEADWWDQVIQKDLSLMNRIYVMTGDISIYDEELNYAVYFNKKVVEDYEIDDPYETVHNDNWTIDTMMTNGRLVSRDLDGDGKRTEFDSFGVLTDPGMLWLFFYTSGQSIAKLDAEGEPYFTAGTPRAAEVAEGLVKMFNETDTVLWAGKCSKTWTTLDQILMENRCLYRPGSIYDIIYYRNMDADFGILPYPKYDEKQDDYYHIIASHVCPGIAIPSTNTDTERTGLLLEALAYESRDTVTEAYYDVNLYTKLSRDNASGDMLDIIFATKCYDVARVFGWGNTDSIFSGLATSSQSFATQWAAREESSEAAKEITMEFFRGK